ncbi:MAG: class I SAM-dependent methyltransferase [Dehalococcoidales bacterium]|nr:class I SAM-dependent methyltransferase [Dehalococcoidales bacterium]
MTEKEGWKSEKTIRHYQRTADITIPGRRDILSKIADLATVFVSHQPKILDLGCGSGDVAAEIIRIRPDALIYMVDFSEGMIQMVRDRFQNNRNIEIITHDLNKGIPDILLSKKFDAVTSCFALHHVDYENRIGLYTQIKHVLCDGGLFINGDIFIGESPSISEWELNNLIIWIVDQAKSKLGIERTFNQVKQRHLQLAEEQGDKPGTLRDMQEGLRQAGFQYVDCVWMENRHAIITGSNT